jgi:membrane protease YdiL (CAAX protease family)
MNSENYNPNPLQPEPGPESGPETQVEKSSEGSAHPFGSELPSNFAASERHTDVQANGVVKPPVAEDLRVPWGWWDLALFAVIAAIGFLTFAFLIIAVFQTAGISRVQFQNSIKYQGLASILAIFIVSLFLLLYLALQLRIRFGVPFWRTLRWWPLDTGKVPPWIGYLGFVLGGFLLSMLVGLVSSAFTPKNKMPIEQFLQDRHTAFLLLVLSVTLAPFFEETIFRGYLYPVVARTFGVIPGVVFTGLLFGLMHASQLGGNLPQVALLVTVGIAFTAVRAKTGSVLPGYLVHVSYNSFISIAFLIASRGLRHMPHF